MDKHFLQSVGTAMGTKTAPPYTNLFMGRLKETIRKAFIWAISLWKRFIDYIHRLSMETHLLIPATLFATWVAPPSQRPPSLYHRHSLHGLQYHVQPHHTPPPHSPSALQTPSITNHVLWHTQKNWIC